MQGKEVSTVQSMWEAEDIAHVQPYYEIHQILVTKLLLTLFQHLSLP